MNVLFNTSMESSVRSLVVLARVGEPLDLDLLVHYDYFLVHSGDYPHGPQSLHPPVPHRSGELLVRRDVVRSGLDLGCRKGLVELCYEGDGLRYRSTVIAVAFLKYFRSKYYTAISARADWIARTLHTKPREELFGLVKHNIEKWGADNAQFLLAPGE